jgi:L-ascorbate metabolism protein UlaG (beta-lactamase superfamily)
MKLNNINLELTGHSGFLITTETKTIAIDPYNLSNKIPKVDIILITHSHYDHCSIKDIEKISKEGTTIIIPADAQSKITKIKNINMEIVEPGDNIEISNLKIQAIPAYNIKKSFHEKKEGWLGYIIKLESTIIYHAGDTDKIPEMNKLTGYGKKDNQFITLLPVSGNFTMDAEEAAQVASLLSPDLAIPMHYGSGVAGTIEDAKQFAELCKELNIKTQILEKI